MLAIGLAWKRELECLRGSGDVVVADYPLYANEVTG